ncbi:MAG: hypothetical protein AAGF93_23945 [Cyanobacteria bacterium P01_H01_bin.105]
MVGMMIPGSSALSDYCSRTVIIDVTGMVNQAVSRFSNYQIKVPFSQMSTAIHQITCQGGKVEKVVVVGSNSTEPTNPDPAKAAVSTESTNPASAKTAVLSNPVGTAVDINKETKSVVQSKKKAVPKRTKGSQGFGTQGSQASNRKGRSRSKKKTS